MKKILVLLAAAGLLATGVTRAETLSGEEKSPHYSSGEIVVTAGRVEELKKEVTSSVLVISREEIKESPATDLGELLAEKSIGNIQKYPGANTTIGIRGFRSDAHGNDLKGKVLILLNGRRAGTGNLAKLSTSNVERIEIIRGPAAVQYGSAAMGGVVNVITAKGKGVPSLFAQHMQGSDDFQETSAGMSGTLGRFDYSGSLSFSDREDYTTASGETYYNTAYNGKVVASLNAGYEFLDGHRIGVVVNHFDIDRTGSPSYFVRNDRSSYIEEQNRSVDIIYTGKPSEGYWSWMARYFVGEDFYGYRSPSISYSSDRSVDQKGAQGQVTFSPEWLSVTAGFDWLDYVVESTMAPRESEYENPAAFLLLKKGFLDDMLVVSGGLRYDKYDVRIDNGEGNHESTDNINGSVGLAYNPADGFKLRVNYADGFRMPSAGELAGYYPYWGGGFYEGNPDLKPEKSSTIEFGADYQSGGVTTSLTWFHSDFRDKIQESGLDSGNRTWVNLGGATIAGVEGEFSYAGMYPFTGSNLSFTPFVSFTWLSEYNDDDTGDYLLYTPEWNASGGIRVKNESGFKGVFTLAYFGKKYVQDYVTSWAGDVIAKEGFTVANLVISKKFTLDREYGRGFTITGEIENLFDRDYEYVNGYPMPGRSFNLGLRVDI
uniref:TonB-dependent receptor n=1 Tax=Chlorobium phaeobacteroides (strain BS1) TaxID=331678 RepID=B3EJS6_CHLPB